MGCTSSKSPGAVAETVPPSIKKVSDSQCLQSYDDDDDDDDDDVAKRQDTEEISAEQVTVSIDPSDVSQVVLDQTVDNEAHQGESAGDRDNLDPASSIRLTERLDIDPQDAALIRRARGKVVNYLGLNKSLLTDVGLLVEDCPRVNTNWKLQVDKGDIKVYTTYVDGSPWIICKTVAVIPADRDDVWALILNDYRMGEYDKMTAECSVVRVATERAVVRRIASVSIWPVSRRDLVSISIWDELSDESFLMSTISIDDPACRPTSAFVRAAVISGGYLLQPVRRKSESSSPESVLTFFAHSDLGGAIPASIVNMLATQTPVQMCTQISKRSQDPKVRPQLTGKALIEDQEIQKQINAVAEFNKKYKFVAGKLGSQEEVTPTRLQLVANSRSEPIVFAETNSSEPIERVTSRDVRYSSLIPTLGSEPKLFCGYILKEGRIVKSMKRRYFILEKGVLSYYESEQSSTAIGEPLDLRGYSVDRPHPLKLILKQSASHADEVNAAANTYSSRSIRDSGLPTPNSIVLPQALSIRRELLLEFASEQDLTDWQQSFEEHIKFRNKLSLPEICTGYIRKQGRFVKNWKLRFFVLDKGVLSYYESSTRYAQDSSTVQTLKAVGESLALTAGTAVTVVPPAGLSIVTDGTASRTLKLEFEDNSEITRWKAALDDHIEYLSSL